MVGCGGKPYIYKRGALHTQRRNHHDIRARHLRAAQVPSARRRRGELGFEKVPLQAQVGVQEHFFDGAGDEEGERPEEEGGGGFDAWGGGCEDFLSFFKGGLRDKGKEHTVQQQPNHQIRHHAPLGIMHEIPVPDPGLRLPAHPAFGGALRVPRRRELRSEILDQVFDDRARFGEDQGLWGVRGLDAQDGEFAQRVHVLEGAGRETVFALVGFEGVGEVEVFEEEEDALGAGLGEPVFGGGRETRR